MLRILFVGPQWHGSNAAGLTRALRQLGHAVKAIDPDAFFPFGQSTAVRFIRRLARSCFVREYNNEILKYARIMQPHFTLVYKGSGVLSQSVTSLRGLGAPVFLIYPDVSLHSHDRLIPRCVPLYDWVFTTKSFGPHDLQTHFGINCTEFLPHGFDPSIHRPLALGNRTKELFGCDVSFIGNWSPKKERILTYLAEQLPDIHLRVWGPNWTRVGHQILSQRIEGSEILGDVYPLAIQCSSINLAILHEKVAGASSGDRTTSRTFHIPGSGGFMLHERTDEVRSFFQENEEMACFGSPAELVDKVRYYLECPAEREQIRLAGHRRARADHSLEKRAERIINRYAALVDAANL